MKRDRYMIVAAAVLLILTVSAAVWHLTSRTSTPEGTLRIEDRGRVTELPLAQLELTAIRGTVVNAKGDVRDINAQGVLLSSVLRAAGVTTYTQVAVVADDEYSAIVKADETQEPDRVYLLVEEGKRPQLLVFGDTNSKRNVSGVIRLVVS